MNEKLEQIADLFDVDVDSFTPETSLDDLEWDSLSRLSLMVLLQKNYQKKVNVTDLKELKTVQDILNLMD